MTHYERAKSYAGGVVAGDVLACKWVRLACERHLSDLTKDWGYRFDVAAAERACRFIECLPHIKGKWGGTPIKLEPWQCFIVCVVFGWLRKDNGKRRFRTVYVEVPRKNAKSTLSSAIGLYMETADGEPGAEVYSAATTRDQAKIVFQDAQNMARKTPDLREHYGLAVNAHNINVVSTGSKFEALSAEGETLDGLNIHCAIVDELHAHKTRAVWDVLNTGTGAREQSLIWAITTAGANKTGICYEVRDYLTKVLQAVVEDETFFGLIYTLDDGDEWTEPSSWRKANPNYGVSVLPDDIERLAKQAMQTPAAVNNFLTKRLNVWVTADVGLFDMRAWAECEKPGLKAEDFAGCPCWIAVDLGFVDDIAAVVKVFRKDGNDGTELAAFGRYYLPEEVVESSRNSQYSGWVRMGRITTTDGNVTDTERIIDDLADDLARYDVRELSFDPYNKLALTNPMERRGVSAQQMREFPQSVVTMSPATEELMKAVLGRKLKHDGCPVLSWAMSNVVGHFDTKDNVYPRKERNENKIDPAIALIMAYSRATSDESNNPYATRGVLSF